MLVDDVHCCDACGHPDRAHEMLAVDDGDGYPFPCNVCECECLTVLEPRYALRR